MSYTMHRVAMDREERRQGDPTGIAIVDEGGNGYILGDLDQVKQVIELLQSENFEEMLDVDDEVFGNSWLTIQEALEYANQYNPEIFKIDNDTAKRFRQQAYQNPDSIGAKKEGKFWRFSRPYFHNYLVKASQRKTQK